MKYDNNIINNLNDNFHGDIFFNKKLSIQNLAINDKKNNQPISPGLFKNHELQKSMSLDGTYSKENNPKNVITSNNKFLFTPNYNSNGYPGIENSGSFITLVSFGNQQLRQDCSKPSQNFPKIINNFTRNKSYKIFNQNKCFSITSINDEKFYRTTKPHKVFSFPKKYFTIRQYRPCHDSNNFNINNLFTDHTKKYQTNSYKLKQLVEKDKFINKIKKDLMSLKYNNQIKPLDNL